MVNIFFSALIAIFFLGKSTKEVQEKTRNASWFRTFAYLILAAIFFVFFYKSYQVRTIVNSIDINTLRGAEDSLCHSADTIEYVRICNNFKTLRSYNNPFFDQARNDSSYISAGGVEIKIGFSKSPVEMTKDSRSFTDDIKKSIESQTGIAINPNTGSIYNCRFMSIGIPNLIHVYPTIRYDEPNVEYFSSFTTIEEVGNVVGLDLGWRVGISKSDIEEGDFIDGLAYQKTIVIHDDNYFRKANDAFKIAMPHKLVNTMGLFTAGDLSQYTYCLQLNTDMYVKGFDVVYNVPVEIGNQAEGMVQSANGFGIYDSEMVNKELVNQPMMFLVKLPSMANLQQIRLFVLTALMTAFFSLFCTNLFFRLRKWALGFRKKHKLKFSERRKISRKRVNRFKWFIYTIVFTFLLFVLTVVIMSAFDFVFLVEEENLGWRITCVVIFIILALSVAIYYSYKYAITPPSELSGQESEKAKVEKTKEQRLSKNQRKTK